MASSNIDIETFIGLSDEYLIIDVRSPSEYNHAHFPGAFSLPLFNDEERKVVGTTYKQVSREKAIKVGLDFFGPKMRTMVEFVERELKNRNQRTVLVHCWRGGMRSQTVAWLLDLYGFKVYVLKGGYKRFRNWVLEQFERPQQLRILSGKTGSGKTEILNRLKEMGEAVIDLEELAGHRGSAFGGLGLPAQPSNEFFENKLALELYKQGLEKPGKAIWLESESSRIGGLNIPFKLFDQMKLAERINIEINQNVRLERTLKEYGSYDIIQLEESVERIQRRLGGLEAKNAINYLEEGQIEKAFEILLNYYDKGYKSNTIFQPSFLDLHLNGGDCEENAATILKEIKKYNDSRKDKVN